MFIEKNLQKYFWKIKTYESNHDPDRWNSEEGSIQGWALTNSESLNSIILIAREAELVQGRPSEVSAGRSLSKFRSG